MRLRLLAFTALATSVASAVACDEYGSSGFFGTTPSALPATKLAFTVQPNNVSVGLAINPPVRVTVQNENGGTVTASTNTITISITSGTGTSGAVLGGTRVVEVVSGVASFPSLTIDRAGGGFTLTAVSGNLTPATSSSFSVNP